MDVTGVMHDFEWVLNNSIERWFKCKYHLDCFFYWKQTIRHNMIDKGFHKDVVNVILPLFDFLMVIKKNDIQKGVEYLRQMVHKTKGIKRSKKKHFDKFLDKYFIQTWLKKRLIKMFNYNSDDNKDWKREM